MPACLPLIRPADDEDDVQIQRQIEREARKREAIIEDDGALAGVGWWPLQQQRLWALCGVYLLQPATHVEPLR